MNRDGSKFLNPREVLFRDYIVCVFGRDIDRQKFICKSITEFICIIPSLLHIPYIDYFVYNALCLNALKYSVFWKNTDEPSLMKFLDFRLRVGRCGDEISRYRALQGDVTKRIETRVNERKRVQEEPLESRKKKKE
ncbi:hypothetical protein GLOIN_2v1762694 [Rhizophagus irregularis DAOM 181602=DAOM 197198]|nr:hypothetical protein GLOIN_2v1762694 [Rhizophagus irregularis DAOM 181602=DAOM 197198]